MALVISIARLSIMLEPKPVAFNLPPAQKQFLGFIIWSLFCILWRAGENRDAVFHFLSFIFLEQGVT